MNHNTKVNCMLKNLLKYNLIRYLALSRFSRSLSRCLRSRGDLERLREDLEGGG